jgi:hypothetical protein
LAPTFDEEWREEQNAKEREHILNAKVKAQDDYQRLKHAVRALFDAAYWHADRPCDGEAIWKELRFAAQL